MKFSVIIPTKDRKEILLKGLNSLKAVKGLNELQVTIINDSEKELVLGSEFDFVTVYRNPGSGVASARNFGVSKALNEWLVFMDDDMIVKPDSFEKLAKFCDNTNRCVNLNWVYPDFILNNKESNPFIRYLIKYKFDSMEGWSNDPNWNNKEPFKVNGINSAFLLIHKNTFEKVGGYDENFPFAGFEDHDISERLRKSGTELLVDTTNTIYHNEEDRINIENWMERKRRGAITRKVAVSRGYTDLVLNYPFVKAVINQTVYGTRKATLATLNNWPKTKALDSLFFLMINRLLGAYSFAGYTGVKS